MIILTVVSLFLFAGLMPAAASANIVSGGGKTAETAYNSSTGVDATSPLVLSEESVLADTTGGSPAALSVERFLDDDIRFPTLPYYTYRSGLGLTSPDSTFRLNIRFRMQNRASLNLNEHADDTIDGVVRRLRLRFDGFVGDPRFLYAIQLSFAPGDVGTVRDGDNLNVIRDAMFFYRPNDRINLGFGQTKLPGNRQRLNSSGALQLTDRSINNARFTIDRDYGVHAYYLN